MSLYPGNYLTKEKKTKCLVSRKLTDKGKKDIMSLDPVNNLTKGRKPGCLCIQEIT